MSDEPIHWECHYIFNHRSATPLSQRPKPKVEKFRSEEAAVARKTALKDDGHIACVGPVYAGEAKKKGAAK